MSARGSYVTTEEAAFARDVCLVARTEGIKCREVVMPHGSRFDWQMPSGDVLIGRAQGERQITFVHACAELRRAVDLPEILEGAQ